jgi:hypothetical protein
MLIAARQGQALCRHPPMPLVCRTIARYLPVSCSECSSVLQLCFCNQWFESNCAYQAARHALTHALLPLLRTSQLICWKSGQYSRVHNHASSHCWLTLLSGEVEEEAFETADGVASMRPGSPRPVMPGG